MTRDEVLAVVQRWQDAYARRDFAAIAEFYDEDVQIMSPSAGAIAGRDNVVKVAEAFLAAFPDLQLIFETPLIDGDRVVSVAHLSGTNFGGFMGLPPTGKAFKFTIVFVVEFKDGLIVNDRRIYDFTGLLIQIGVLKAKPA